MKSTKFVDQIIESNMMIMLKSAKQDEKEAKAKMIKSKIELSKVMRENTYVGIEFKNMIDIEWNIGWKEHEKACKKKIKGLQKLFSEKFEEKKAEKPLMYVKYRDADLIGVENKNEYDNDTKVSAKKTKDALSNANKENKADEGNSKENQDIVNLGYDELDDNMKSVLQKHPGFTVYKEVKESNIEIAAEECLVKVKYDIMSKEANSNSVDPVPEVGESTHNTKDIIDLTYMEATDMKRNKRVYIPEPSDMELEIKCQNLK